MGNQSGAALGNDRQAVPVGRLGVLGGFRAGTHATPFGQFIGTINMGLIASYPIVSYHIDRDISGVSTTVSDMTPVGTMVDIRGILLTNFQPQQEVDIDGDTWVLFPTRKIWPGSGSLINTSGYQGIMIKKN